MVHHCRLAKMMTIMDTLIVIFLITGLVTLVQKPGRWDNHISHLLITLWQTREGQCLLVNIAYRRTIVMNLWVYLHKKKSKAMYFLLRYTELWRPFWTVISVMGFIVQLDSTYWFWCFYYLHSTCFGNLISRLSNSAMIGLTVTTDNQNWQTVKT
jgi:hypothetical protein